MDKFQKYKKDIISGLNIAIILSIIVLVGNLLYAITYSGFNLTKAFAFIIVGGVSLGFLFWAKNQAQKENILGGILTLIAGVICLAGNFADLILGVVLIVMAVAYLIAFGKYKK